MPDVPYGITLASFYTGHTGMRLQLMGAPGKDALILGGFLTANEWANMIGLYELSPTKLSRALPSVKGKALSKAFELLGKEEYAFYDQLSEFVWVREMARIRLDLELGVAANTKSNRIISAQNLYQRLPRNPYLGLFYDRYHVELSLRHRRNGDRMASRDHPDTNRMASERRRDGIGMGTETCLVPPSTPSGTSTSGSAKQDQGTQDQEERAAASPRPVSPSRSHPNHNGNASEHYSQILALVHKEILPTGLTNVGDLEEATKSRCAHLRIPYNSEVVRKAVESALHQRRAS